MVYLFSLPAGPHTPHGDPRAGQTDVQEQVLPGEQLWEGWRADGSQALQRCPALGQGGPLAPSLCNPHFVGAQD